MEIADQKDDLKTVKSETPKKQAPKGCVVAFLIGIVVFVVYFIYSAFFGDPGLPSEKNAYAITTNFIEDELDGTFNELDCPFADYRYDYLNDSSYLIVSYFNYKNEWGVQKRYDYKASVKWNGGRWSQKKNWTLVYLEEYKPME